MRKQVGDRRERFTRLVGFGGDDAEVELRQFARVIAGLQASMKFVAPCDPDAAIVDAAGVLLATDKHPNLGHARQVCGV